MKKKLKKKNKNTWTKLNIKWVLEEIKRKIQESSKENKKKREDKFGVVSFKCHFSGNDSFGLVSHFEQKNAQLWISRRSWNREKKTGIGIGNEWTRGILDALTCENISEDLPWTGDERQACRESFIISCSKECICKERINKWWNLKKNS